MVDTENKLQIAKSILKKFVTGECVTDDEIIEAFPDLGESDDEKTRKDIRKFVEAFAQWNDRRRFCDWLDKHKEHGSTEKQDYSGLTDFQRAIHRGFLCAGVGNVPRAIIEETAQDCINTLRLTQGWKPAWSEED